MPDTYPVRPRNASDARTRQPWVPPTPAAAVRHDLLLGAAAHAAEVLTATPDLRAALAEAAGVLGAAAGVDRVNVFRYDHARSAGFLHAEWARPGVTPVSAVDPGPYADADYAEVMRPLRAGQVYHSPLREKTGANAALNVATQTKSDLFVPVLVDGRFWGMLNFDDCTTERAWSEGEVEVLRAAAAAVAAAVQREALERAHREALAGERERAAVARAAALTAANARLAKRLHLVEAAVETADALLAAPAVEAAMPAVLARLGQALGADRALLMRFTPADTESQLGWAMLDHEWTAPGISRQGDDPALARLNLDHYRDVFQRLHRERIVVIHTPDLPDAARAEQEATGARSQVVITVLDRGRVWGFLGFDDCHAVRVWDEAEVGLVQIVAASLGGALEREALAAARAAAERAVLAEREQAAEARAAELAKANDALQRTAARLAAEQDLDAFLRQTLVEVATQLGGDTAVVTPYDPATDTFRLGALVVDGREAPPGSMPAALPRVDSAFAARLLATDTYEVFDTEREPELFWPGAVEFLRAHGCRYSLSFPIRLGGRLLGQLSVAYAAPPRPAAEQTALVRALSHQAALAIEVTRLGDQARTAAVAREREQAAEARAAELAHTNAALHGTLAALTGGHGLGAFLASVLGEAERQAGAAATAVFRFDPATDTLALLAACADGAVATPDAAPWLAPFRRPTPVAEAPGWRALLAASGPLLVHAADDPTLTWPVAWGAHQARGHATLGYVRVQVGDRPLGFLGLAWREAAPALIPARTGVLTILAQQLALALELDRLAADAAAEQKGAAVLEERTRLAREVHDTIAQGLAGVVMQLAAARATLGDAEGPARPALDRVDRLARENLAEARRSIAMLRPMALEHHGLDAAIREAVDVAREAVAGRGPNLASAAGGADDRAADGGTRVALDIRGTPARLPADVDMELLRIAQAALANAVQHAHAREIRVELAVASRDGVARDVRLSVTDDGRGFDPDAAHPARFGLVGMSERAVRVGAVLTVVTAPGEGTDVVVMWRAAESDGPGPDGLRPGASA